MARIDALNILLDGGTKDKLAESYGKVIENIEKSTISGLLKNKDLSGDPTTGTVEAKKFVNATSKAYGTARTAGKADAVEALPVTISIDTDKEIIEEVENKDLSLYGVDGMIARRTENHGRAMKRELERAFFTCAGSVGTTVTTTTATTVQGAFEEIIQTIESTSNDYIDGVDRDLIHIIANPHTYGEIRDYLDTLDNANVNSGAGEFGMYHGVMVHSSVYLPSTVDFIGMVEGSIAQPVLVDLYDPKPVELSNAVAFGIFYSYGTKCVNDALVKPAKVGTGT